MSLIRTKRDGVFRLQTNGWGTRPVPCDDPDANVEETPTGFSPAPTSRVPASLWSRVVRLFFHFADDRHEVSIIWLRSVQGTDWRAMVPKQEVTAVTAVCKLDDLIDIADGSKHTRIPDGWYHAGSAHSHHTMEPTPSGTDDASELGCPGLHVILGGITPGMTYRTGCSIVQAKHRYKVPREMVIDYDPASRETYHDDVLTQVSVKRETITLCSKDDYSDDVIGWYRSLNADVPIVTSGYADYLARKEASLTPKQGRVIEAMLASYRKLPDNAQEVFRNKMWDA